MNVLVLGKKGWLGGIFYDYLKKNNINVSYTNQNINLIESFNPDIDVVANFAASASIDWCEKNKNMAFENNVLGALNLAKLCSRISAKYVFISSACIFQSNNENDIQYEDAIPRPGCFYTETKLMAERLIKELLTNYLIVRLRLPVSEVPHPRNALNKLSTYSKLVNTQESATVVEDFIPRLFDLIKNNEVGDFNLINEGTISPAQIGNMIGSKFEVFTKDNLDKEMNNEGRAHRVSTVAGTKFGYLPPIQERIVEVVNRWKNG